MVALAPQEFMKQGEAGGEAPFKRRPNLSGKDRQSDQNVSRGNILVRSEGRTGQKAQRHQRPRGRKTFW
jgi:hypothetical protein